MFVIRGIRHTTRLHLTKILIITTIVSLLLTLHLYQKDKQYQEVIQPISSTEQSKTLPYVVTETGNFIFIYAR
jgi:hypothetical protein